MIILYSSNDSCDVVQTRGVQPGIAGGAPSPAEGCPNRGDPAGGCCVLLLLLLLLGWRDDVSNNRGRQGTLLGVRAGAAGKVDDCFHDCFSTL